LRTGDYLDEMEKKVVRRLLTDVHDGFIERVVLEVETRYFLSTDRTI
jgi:hypothetical protein